MYKDSVIKLKQLRTEKNFTQQEVAENIGLSQSEYSKIENNQIKLDFEIASRLARFYKISLKEIIDFEKNYYIENFSQSAINTESLTINNNDIALKLLEQISEQNKILANLVD
jgi:transcriptional regulator with XRE-family HTH domain